MLRHKKLWIVLTSVFAFLMIVFIVALPVTNMYRTSINSALNISLSKIVETGSGDEDTEYYKSDWADKSALEEYEDKLCQQLEAEGAVLLKNDNNALPLSTSEGVTLFSQSSYDFLYGGTGSGDVDTSSAMTLSDALEDVAGLSVNSTMRKWYRQMNYSRKTPATTGGYSKDYAINEVPVSEMKSTQTDTIKDYPVAIVTLARSGGEGSDLPFGNNVDGCATGGSDCKDGDYLILNDDEIAMFEMLKSYKQSGQITKIIVLLNGSNALQLDFLDDYGIDAALWVGDVGQTGIKAVANILAGNVNPSGRLVDTFLCDNHSSPAMQNFGVYEYSNKDALNLDTAQNNQDGGVDRLNSRYVVYEEGIYVGYKYYETRYEDYVMGTGNAGDYDYDADVAYPFGYGLSYTNGGSYEYSNFSVKENGDSFTVSVDVTNNTGRDGKHTVQIYMQSPYTDYDKTNGIEKAAVQLVGFDKQEIKSGDKATYKIDVDKREMAAYDSNEAETYVVDAGDYYFTVGRDAHDATNNILAAKGFTTQSTSGRMDADGESSLVYKCTEDSLDDETYSTSEATGYEITNQFDNADLNKYTSANMPVTYLTRSDWTGTFPTPVKNFAVTEQMWEDGLAPDDSSAHYTDSSRSGADVRQDLIEQYEARFEANYKDGEEITEVPTMGASGELQLIMFMDADYDDPLWEDLLDQATYGEMTNVIYNGFHLTYPIASIGLPDTVDENGPQGLTFSLTGGGSSMCYTSEDVMAATYNRELLAEMGECIGEDCLRMGAHGLYGPGGNIHRTPYCGRNFEYYSEDGFLASELVGEEVKAIQSNGVYVFMKHFVLNDQENGRYGVSTFANEQTIRELYLRPFEGAAVNGKASGFMTSFNRIGVVWSGANYNLMTNVCRNEWGMTGMMITDCTMFCTPYDYRLGVLSGQNLWDGMATGMTQFDGYDDDPVMVTAIRESIKRISYTVLHSHAMNGVSSTSKIVAVTPWWWSALVAGLVVFAVLAVASAVLLTLSCLKGKGKGKKDGSDVSKS